VNAHYNTLQFAASTTYDRPSERTLQWSTIDAKVGLKLCHCIAEDEHGQATMDSIQLPLCVASRCWNAVMHCVRRQGNWLLHPIIPSVMVLDCCIALYLGSWQLTAVLYCLQCHGNCLLYRFVCRGMAIVLLYHTVSWIWMVTDCCTALYTASWYMIAVLHCMICHGEELLHCTVSSVTVTVCANRSNVPARGLCGVWHSL